MTKQERKEIICCFYLLEDKPDNYIAKVETIILNMLLRAGENLNDLL